MLMAKKGIKVLINTCVGWTDNFSWSNVECDSDDLVLSKDNGDYHSEGNRVSNPIYIPFEPKSSNIKWEKVVQKYGIEKIDFDSGDYNDVIYVDKKATHT